MFKDLYTLVNNPTLELHEIRDSDRYPESILALPQLSDIVGDVAALDYKLLFGMDQKVLDEIASLDWDTLSRRLLAVTVYWAKIYHKSNWRDLPKGYTHEDVLQESYRRALSRPWPTFNENEFFEYLKGAVRSVVSNLAKSERLQKTSRLGLFAESGLKSDENIEDQFEKEEVIQKIYKTMKGEQGLTEVFELMCEGYAPRHISDKMNIPVNEIYNMKKRIIRIIEEIAKDL